MQNLYEKDTQNPHNEIEAATLFQGGDFGVFGVWAHPRPFKQELPLCTRLQPEVRSERTADQREEA